MNRRPLLLPLVAVVALTACGPKVELQTSISSEGTTILLGLPKQVAANPIGPDHLPTPSFPGLVTGTPPISVAPVVAPPVVEPPVGVPPAAPVVACPKLLPTDFPKVIAGPLITAPPKAGTYAYRQSGTSIANSDPAIALPAKDNRVVAMAPTATGATFSFTVTSTTFGGVKTTTTYSLVPPASSSAVTVPGTALGNSPATVQAMGGLYVTKVETAGQPAFTPVGMGYEVFAEPASPGLTFSSTAVDPNTQNSLLVQGKVVGHDLADACGQAVDGWKVELTETILGAQQNLTDTETIIVAPQYGGLVVEQVGGITGTYNGNNVTQKVAATINRVPGSTP